MAKRTKARIRRAFDSAVAAMYSEYAPGTPTTSMPSTAVRPSPAVTIRTAWPRSTKRRANSYERVPPPPARVMKN